MLDKKNKNILNQTQRHSTSIRPLTQGNAGRNLFMFRPKMNKQDSAALSVFNMMNQSDEESQPNSHRQKNRMKIVNVVDHNGVEHKIFHENPLMSPTRSSARHFSLISNSVEIGLNSSIIS
jgi:hypothetical protein